MINQLQKDVLTELINIGVGKGAEVLNTMVGSHISLEVPTVEALPYEDLQKNLDIPEGEEVAAVHMEYSGKFSGEVQLFFPADAAVKLVKLILDDDFPEEEMDAIRRGTLTELGNVVINAVIGSISNIFQMHFKYTVPAYMQGSLVDLVHQLTHKDLNVILLAKTHFKIKVHQLSGNIVLFFSMDTFQNLLNVVNSYAQ
jgi:chemotaxis protein CheC